MATLLAGIPGCEVVAFIAHAVFPKKIRARHRLADRPTLVLVDDPANHLDNPATVTQIANEVGFHLVQKNVLSQTNVISFKLLHALVERLGDHYARTPIDRIGREVGAEQIIHVHIMSAGLRQEPGLLRPMARLQVKIIDVPQGKRLFPLDTEPEASASNQSGAVVVKMPHQNDRGGELVATRDARQALAERIGRDVSRLFFDYTPRQPGQAME